MSTRERAGWLTVGAEGGSLRSHVILTDSTLPEPPVAAFDLDRTLTTRDSFGPFLATARGWPAVVGAFARRPWRAVRAAGGGPARDEMKALVLRHLLAGLPADELEELGSNHARRIVAEWLRPDVADRLRWHQDAGHHTVIVSASLRCYVAPVGVHLGVDDVLATELAVGDDGRLTGELAGVNCRGPEKAARLAARFGPDRPPMYAYGDSRGDREMLAAATYPTRVDRRPLPPVPAAVGLAGRA